MKQDRSNNVINMFMTTQTIKHNPFYELYYLLHMVIGVNQHISPQQLCKRFAQYDITYLIIIHKKGDHHG